MSGSFESPGRAPADPGHTLFWPQTGLGRWALVMTVVAIASWFLLPLITVNFRDTYPITDTWVMPAILTLLTDTATALGIAAIWLRDERSVLTLAALCLMVPAALFVTAMVISEGLAGV